MDTPTSCYESWKRLFFAYTTIPGRVSITCNQKAPRRLLLRWMSNKTCGNFLGWLYHVERTWPWLRGDKTYFNADHTYQRGCLLSLEETFLPLGFYMCIPDQTMAITSLWLHPGPNHLMRCPKCSWKIKFQDRIQASDELPENSSQNQKVRSNLCQNFLIAGQEKISKPTEKKNSF